ncbi:DUF3592 domain-containing protein [Sungkyunkwania multivorans]|uniref:DUF3592 domain-containing protein n=1 Tax=Sungkyunkwania multivorans TaxID=1173618 RepID=A0ABW3CWE7_9FLAO
MTNLMRSLYLLLPLLLFGQHASAQNSSTDYIETEALIKEINFSIKSRRSSATAKVDYVTREGDSLSSIVKLPHVPFIGTWYDEGDTVTVLYNKQTPQLLKTKGTLFTESYGVYLLVLLGLIVLLYRYMRNRKR